MKIIVINHYAGSPTLGMEYRPYYLAKQWVNLGHDVTIIASTNSHIRQNKVHVKYDFDEEMVDGVRYVWVKTPMYKGNGAKRVYNMLSFVTKLWMNALRISKLYNPDIVIASSTYTFDNYAALKIAKISGAKYFYEVHDLWPLSPIELGGMSEKHLFIRALQNAENYAYRWADKVISMLPHTQEHMESHGLDLAKWRYIPNGICETDWQKSQEIPNELVVQIDQYKSQGNRLIAYTGTLGLANALDNLIHAAELMKESKVKFLIFGLGPEEVNLRNLILKKNLTNIHLMGSVSKMAIPNLLSKMDILYIGLKHQSLFRFGISPNKLIDYMMSSKPIIQAIDAGNDMVSEANCGISIAPENPIQLVNAIQNLLGKTDDELVELGANGKAFVMKNHIYKKLAEDFIKIMQE